jgi:uncharacterized protein (TIGR03118 family)
MGEQAMIVRCPSHFLRRTTAATPLLLTLLPLSLLPSRPAAAQYLQHNLVSDQSGVADFTDPNLVNAWGIATSGTSPFWVANNGTGTATLYNTKGAPQSLVVNIPAPGGGAAAPTGQVFNGTTDFAVDGLSARFIYSTEDGTVNAWAPGATGTTAVVAADHSGAGAVYKGLALDNNGSGNFLYATDFANGHIDVFNSTFADGSASLTGNFTDPNAPTGYAAFNVQNLGGTLFVTYAKQQVGSTDEAHGTGFGFVDAFDANGNFLRRVASGTDVGGTLTDLNAPWGLALAPSTGFGKFDGDLLVGNFGNGRILAFDPVTDAFKGLMTDALGNPLVIDGLWGLRVGNGGNGGAINKVYFSAGPADESHGLLGSLTAAAPEPGVLPLILIGAPLLGLLFTTRRRRESATA